MVDSNLTEVMATQLPRNGGCKSRQRRLTTGFEDDVTRIIIIIIHNKMFRMDTKIVIIHPPF